MGGTYEVMLKYSEQEVRDHINRYGIDRASVDVKELAKDMVSERFSEMSRQREPVLEMPNGDILHIAYNRETDSLDANLQEVGEKLNGMEEYQAEEIEQRSAFHR